MAQKDVVKHKESPKITGRSSYGELKKTGSGGGREGRGSDIPVVRTAVRAEPGGLFSGWFKTVKPEDTVTEHLAAVKSGVLHELEHMSAQRGTPVKTSPFSTIVLPPRAQPRSGVKWAILALFLLLFVGIMFMVGQRAPQPYGIRAHEGVTSAVGVHEDGPGTPVSRADVQAKAAVAPVPMIRILTARKGKTTVDTVTLTLTLGNLGRVPFPAGPLHLTIADAAGQSLKQTTLALDAPLAPGVTRQQTWTIPLVAGNRLDGFVATVPLEALTLHIRPGE